MKFEAGKLSIFGGVNRLTGVYALIDNQSVTLGELVSTQMAGPPERMELERSFSKTIARVDGFHVDGKQLDLLSGGKVVATFKSKE
jgi:heat shock protein HslJ